MSFHLVTIRVGEPDHAVDIPVYRELLSSVSPYFRGAFEGGFKEATNRTIPLTDVTEQTFRIFLSWANAQLQQSAPVPVPHLSILPRGPAAVAADGATAGDSRMDATEDDVDRSVTSAESLRQVLGTAFDEHGYQPWLVSDTKLCAMYYDDEAWVKNAKMSLVSYLNLYIFADKYSVHQLRDDILTAMLGQAFAWDWYPDPEADLLATAYDNLPNSARFLKFLVVCTALFWLVVSDGDCTARLRTLRQWQPDFAFEVSMKQAQMLHKGHKNDDGVFVSYHEQLPNSCVFHEHLVCNANACRERIKNKSHVFVELIEACAKDGISMIKEQEGE